MDVNYFIYVIIVIKIIFSINNYKRLQNMLMNKFMNNFVVQIVEEYPTQVTLAPVNIVQKKLIYIYD